MMNKKATRGAVSALTALALAMALSSCPTGYDGVITTGNRDILVDVPNLLFSAYSVDAIYSKRGVGAESVEITVTTDAGPFVETLAKADISAVYKYTQVPINVSGTLSSVSAVVKTADAGLSFPVSLVEWTDTSAFYGWQTFANLQKFIIKLDTNATSVDTSVLAIQPCPVGGVGLQLFWDSGVDTVIDMGTELSKTDREKALISGQVAISPQWLENPNGLTYDLYALVVDDNIAEKYGVDETGETYLADPWKSTWTCEDILNGRSIGGTVRKLALIEKDLDSIDPKGDGKTSYLLDYSATDDAAKGRYVVVAIIVSQVSVSVASQAVVIPIR